VFIVKRVWQSLPIENQNRVSKTMEIN
jgi:hypothetical protein